MTNHSSRPELDNDIYRDSTTGARIRRRALLSQRRDEFADLPEGIRSVYVTRVCRAVAGLFLALGGALMIAMSASPGFTAWLEGFAPGPRPALATTALAITWGVGALAWFAAWALAERRFTRVMLRAVKPTEDIHDDVERLANVPPATVAARMTNAWEATSTALPILGVAVLLPATLMYLIMALIGGGFVAVAEYEQALAEGSRWLAALGGLGVMAALLGARTRGLDAHALRARRSRFLGLALLGVQATVVGLAVAWYLGATISGALAIVSAFFSWSAHRIGAERASTHADANDDQGATDEASSQGTVRHALRRMRSSIREHGVWRASLAGMRAARERLALSRRLASMIKAPLSWSAKTTAAVFVAGAAILVTGYLGADALTEARATTIASSQDQIHAAMQPDMHDPMPLPVNVDEPTTAVLYTAAPATQGVPGTLLIVDLEAGRFARTDLDIDLQYLPCGKVREDAGWVKGDVVTLEDETGLVLDGDGGETDYLDITSAGTIAPLELRAGDGTVYTPCTTIVGLDMDALADDHALLLD